MRSKKIKSIAVVTHVDPAMAEWLTREADRQEGSRSQVIRKLIRERMTRAGDPAVTPPPTPDTPTPLTNA